MEDNLLINLIPRLYHREDFAPFLRAINRSFIGLERQVDDITTLVDIDTCPDFALPYLAALTECPLWGQNPFLWRKQIKNWPYICRIKGTKRALQFFFDSAGIIPKEIATYWRDNSGNYVTERSKGAPYLDVASGLWYNSRTHYFSILLSAAETDIVNLPDPDLCRVTRMVKKWIAFAKPFHAELLDVSWLVPIDLSIEIQNQNEIMGMVDAHHNYWNRGAAEPVCLDGKYDLDGSCALDALRPGTGWRTKQQHEMEIMMYIEAYQHNWQSNDLDGTADLDGKTDLSGWLIPLRMPRHQPRIWSGVDAVMPVKASHATEIAAGVENRQTVKLHCSIDDSHGAVELRHLSDCRTCGLLDGQACLDGSHDLSGEYVTNRHISNLLTVAVIKNHQVKVEETQ